MSRLRLGDQITLLYSSMWSWCTWWMKTTGSYSIDLCVVYDNARPVAWTILKCAKCLHYLTWFQYYHTRMRLCGNAFCRVCLCVCLSYLGSNFRKPWPRNFIWVCRYIFRISRSYSYIKRIGTKWVIQRNWMHTFAGGLPLIERRSCFVAVLKCVLSADNLQLALTWFFVNRLAKQFVITAVKLCGLLLLYFSTINFHLFYKSSRKPINTVRFVFYSNWQSTTMTQAFSTLSQWYGQTICVCSIRRIAVH